MRKLKSLLIKLFIASFAIYSVYSFLNEDNNKQQINIPIIDQKVTFI